MAQKIEDKTERPLQTYWQKQFAAVNTVANRIAPPQEGCFWDLTNAQPIGFANLHSINGADGPIYDFGAHRVYADFNVNIGNQEYLLIATRDGYLFSYKVGAPWSSAVTQIASGLATDGSLDIAQYDNTTALIVTNAGTTSNPSYYAWQGGTSITPIATTSNAAGNEPSAPVKGQAIAVYQNMVWIADGRTLFFSKPGSSQDTPPAYTDFSTADGGGWEIIRDSTLKSDIKALFALNGLLYVFGEQSIDVIGNVQQQVTTAGGAPTGSTASYTRQNISSIVGTDQVESIMAYGPLIFFANRYGVWMIAGVTVSLASTDVNNGYYSGIDGTWQYLDWNHYNDAIQWINSAGAIVDWQNSSGNTVHWTFAGGQPFLFKISGGQVRSNNLLCAAFLVVRKNDPTMGSGNFLALYQGDATGSSYKWWFADWTSDIGPITHICTANVNYAGPNLFGYINNKLYQFFADDQAAEAPAARIMTPLWDFGDPLSDKQALRAGIRVSLVTQANPAVDVHLDTLTGSHPIALGDIGALDWVNSTEQITPWQSAAHAAVKWQSLRNYMIYWGRAPPGFSKHLGFTVRTQHGTQFELNAFLLDYKVGPRWISGT
jgi:hypothetical protein